jgi:hypothetical protein
MDENKEILKCDLIDSKYFLATEDLLLMIISEGSIKVSDLVLNEKLTFDEKFNYLKSQILKEPNLKLTFSKYFLYELKNFIIFSGLVVLRDRGSEEAKRLYDVLTNDKDLEKEIKRFSNE